MNPDCDRSLAHPTKRRFLPRDRWLIASLAGFGLLMLVFRGPIQRQCLAYFLVHSEAPSPGVLAQLVQQTGDPTSLLLRLWRTQRIPHRHFVLGYLERMRSGATNIAPALEAVPVEAAADADLTTRQLAFAALGAAPHRQLRPLALEELDDPDPVVRVLGLQVLRRAASSNDVSTAIRLLNDPDPRVVVAAGMVLREATGQDFGLKSTLALPRFTSIDHTNAPPAPNLTAIRQGAELWRAWWKDHQAEYPTPVEQRHEAPRATGLTTPDFNLKDLQGKPVRLSNYRGKAVLVAFWSLDAPVSLEDAPALNALHGKGDRLVVLGIGLPATASCCTGEDESGPAHAHHQDCPACPDLDTEPGRALAKQTALERKITFPMLVDPKGAVGRRFAVEDLPTYVLIDGQGTVRRRFVGNRTGAVLEAMVAELADPRTRGSR